MGDAAAAAATASTSAPATPTSILICLEDGSDLLSDAYDGAGATDFVVARDEHLLVEDQDEEYVALLLSKESAAVCAPAEEETEEWMKTARSGCVRWIIKTTAMFGFGGKTAYVAVTYLDRFLVQRRVNVTALLVTLHFPSPSPLPASPLSFLISSVEYRPSTIAVASILVARGREETPAGSLDALKAILGSSCPQLDTGHVYSCYRAMIREDDKSPTHSTSTGVASSGVSVAGNGSPSPGANNAAGSGPPATPDSHKHNHNQRRRLRSPQRQ
ncbi:Cyclin-D5-1 [Zea mays]|uniref:Cyclin-D5-1 n=1 Tax=Zea mays TaxID=4577 RepID=A0A1D6JRX6_MAIZE|nr:Cyclin-D5-1 [Zea mays]